jgi:hypothetical protein
MKKMLLVLVAGLSISTAAFADHEGLGLGFVAGGGAGSGHGSFGFGNIGLSLKVPALPVFWSIFPLFYGNGAGFGVNGDFYFIDKDLVTEQLTNEDGTYNFNLDWYLGAGFFANLYTWNNRHGNERASFAAGVRVPIGLSWHIITPLEMFFEIAPSFGFHAGRNVDPFFWGFGAGLGLRYWWK